MKDCATRTTLKTVGEHRYTRKESIPAPICLNNLIYHCTHTTSIFRYLNFPEKFADDHEDKTINNIAFYM